MPEPTAMDRFPSMVEPCSSRWLPKEAIAPPEPGVAQPEIATSLSSRDPSLRMHPPSSFAARRYVYPLRIERPVSSTETDEPRISNTRSVAGGEFAASMIVFAEPAPSIVTSSVRSRSPVAASASSPPWMLSAYVPAGTTMESGPGEAFAAITASRSEQSASQLPSAVSAVLVTVNVAAAAGSATTPARAPASSRPRMRRLAAERFGVVRVRTRRADDPTNLNCMGTSQ